MDKIYSRRRIHIPKVIFQKFKDNNKSKKVFKVCIILAVAIFTFITITRTINPIYNKMCEDKAKSVATLICNAESTKVIQKYKYEDLITIYKDEDNNITMIESNMTPINLIISDVAENIQKSINQTEEEQITIDIGSLTGTKIFSGRGLKVPLRLSTVGNVDTDFRSQFKSAGINQTLHRLYLQVDCRITMITPYKNIEKSISNQVIIAENIIVGKVPNNYYNLEGLDEKDSLEVVE